MSSMRTKHAPMAPSSLLLDKRWKEHDYLLHQYRLRALRGNPGPYVAMNELYGGDYSNPTSQQKRGVASAKPGLSAQNVYLPRASAAGQRPNTSRPDNFDGGPPLAPRRQQWVKSASKNRSQTSKDSPLSSAKPNSTSNSPWATINEQRPNESRPTASVKPNIRPITARHMKSNKPHQQYDAFPTSQRPKTGRPFPLVTPKTGYPTNPAARKGNNRTPLKSKYDEHGRLINPTRRNVMPPLRAIKSEYSRATMNKHFERHQYFRNGLLARNPQRTPSNKQDTDEYSDFFESEDEDDNNLSNESINFKSPAPSPSPLPPVREQSPLYIEPRYISLRTPTPPPLPAAPTIIEPEPFIPPSHIVKLVQDAEEAIDSDTDFSPETDSDANKYLYMREGQEGVFRKENGKYIKVESAAKDPPARRKRLVKKRHQSTKESEDSSDDDLLMLDPKKITYIMYSTDDEFDGLSDEKKIVDDSRCSTQHSKHDVEDDDVEDDDVDEMRSTKGRKERESPDIFDAKLKYDSGSDVDEFDRRRDRQRPSSSIYDYLPPLHPDRSLDDGDVTKCKARLMRNTVKIREELDKNTYDALETVCELIILNNNDNRRWIRKMYRDQYLKSLLVDLRKSLPANVASVISNMMIPACEYDAMCLWDALKGLHKDSEVLIEILITRNNKEMEMIRDAYKLRYEEQLLDHLEDETIGVFQRLLMKLASGKRDTTLEWTRDDAGTEARAISALLDAGGDYLDKKICDVFTRLPLPMLRSIMSEYSKFKGHEMDVDVVKVLKGNYCKCILAMLEFVQNPPNYFVQKLHKSHFGSVDDDKTLCRIVVSRAEKDLVMIKELFMLRYGMELYDYIEQICCSPLKGLALRLLANLFAPDERGLRVGNMPPIWVEEGKIELVERLTLPDAIRIILRKTKIVNKFIKILFAKRERSRLKQEESEESSTDDGAAKENGSDSEKVVAAIDSEEEERREAQEAQRQLRNGLKNISFADNIDDNGENEGPKSVFHAVSFAQASRGILKHTEQPGRDDDDEEENNDAEALDEELGKQTGELPKMTQLNGPVLDPTFVGRESRRGLKRAKQRKFHGTVKGVPMESFDALKDAQAIGKAMLQKNRNTDGILQFMASRNNAQRQLIIREFFRRYRRDLVDDIRTLAPYHEGIVLALLLSSQIYDAASLYAALNGDDLDVKIDVLLEILCTRQNDEIAIIKRAYNGIFGADLQEEIAKITDGYFKTLLWTIADCQRDENEDVDANQTRKDSQALYETMLRRPTDHKYFIDLFATRSMPHIEMVCDLYAKMTQMDILETLDESLEGRFLEGITAIICNVRDAPVYFCERIYRAVAFEPTDYPMLIRCIVSRAEIDLQTIKSAFRRTYGTTIYSMIDQVGDFKSKRILLDIVKK